jgi:hypothetical protein
MQMFIANGLHQNIDFQYRLPQYKSYRTQMIPIGGQIRISGELSQEDIDKIILGHAIYGMVGAKEISKFKGFHIPYVYSIDEPISETIILELVLHNREYNEQLGVKLRKDAAVAVNTLIEENMSDKLTNLEMTIEEVPSKDRDPVIFEGIRVTRDRERGAPQGPEISPFDLASARKAKRPSF